MIANAQATVTDQDTAKVVKGAPVNGVRADQDDLPSMAEIRGGQNFDKAKRLDDKSLGEAMKNAKSFNVEDDKAIVDFGIEEQRAATKMAEKTVEYSRKTDFDAIKDITAEMTAKQRELRIGDLKPTVWDRFLPKGAAKRVNGVLSQHQDISETVRKSLQALAEEKKKLITYRGAAEADIKESEVIIERFDMRVAQLEISREGLNKKVEKFLEEHKDDSDEKTTQRLKHFEMQKGLLERKMNAMVASRADQYSTLENLRNFQATYNVLIQAAEDQSNYNRQAWNNTVSILTHSARQKGVQEAIDAQRQAAGEWLDARGDATVKTVENTMRILKVGVIEVEKITKAIDRAEEANLKLIEGCKNAQTSLLQMSKDIADRTAQASERTATAARGTREEVAGMVSELKEARFPDRASAN